MQNFCTELQKLIYAILINDLFSGLIAFFKIIHWQIDWERWEEGGRAAAAAAGVPHNTPRIMRVLHAICARHANCDCCRSLRLETDGIELCGSIWAETEPHLRLSQLELYIFCLIYMAFMQLRLFAMLMRKRPFLWIFLSLSLGSVGRDGVVSGS